MCCIYGAATVETTKNANYASDGTSGTTVGQICNPTSSTLNSSAKTELVFTADNTDYYCVGGTVTPDTTSGTTTLKCDGGKWVAINKNDNTYSLPTKSTAVVNFYYKDDQHEKETTTGFSTGWLVGELSK